MTHPISIGRVALENPYILAPLAGYTDLAYRLLCREYGAGLCVSEMISCNGLAYRQKNTLAMLKTAPAERPVSFQLFGSEPDIMAEAAAILSEQPIDIIDINMGCPVRKVIKKGAGAALMKDMRLASKIIRAVRDSSSKPVTIKTRTGWSHNKIIAEDFARMAEDAGANAVTVHARTWTDGFSGKPDWQVIERVKQAVTIPVIGNGSILTYKDGLNMMKRTGCDAVMIGRAALGQPWIFRNEGLEDPSLFFRCKALRRHLDLIQEFHSTETGLGRIKNHAGRYFKEVSGAAAIRKRIYDVTSFRKLRELVDSLTTG